MTFTLLAGSIYSFMSSRFKDINLLWSSCTYRIGEFEVIIASSVNVKIIEIDKHGQMPTYFDLGS